jgi:very-short-patch-repair endonuclease/predicted transcriptional regulator of viral defense system
MPTSLDRRALEVAAGQRWILTRAEAYAIGYTSEIIAYRLQSGTWQSIREGCYLVAPVKRDPRVYLEAAVHAIEGAIVSHESAAELYEMKYVPRGLAVVSVPPKTTHDFPGVIIRRPKDLVPDHIEEIDGMPVSTVLRTSFDLTGVYSYARVARILDDAIAAKLIDLEQYRQFAEPLCGRGKPGSAHNRRYLAERGAGFVAPTTELERIFFTVLGRGGLPEPERQVRLPWYRSVPGICDCYYRRERVIAEADGRRWHTLLADFETDRHRDNEAMRNDHRVLRFTYDMLTKQPGRVIETVRDTLALAHR